MMCDITSLMAPRLAREACLNEFVAYFGDLKSEIFQTFWLSKRVPLLISSSSRHITDCWER